MVYPSIGNRVAVSGGSLAAEKLTPSPWTAIGFHILVCHLRSQSVGATVFIILALLVITIHHM